MPEDTIKAAKSVTPVSATAPAPQSTLPDTDPERGLSASQAAERLAQTGPNAIEEKETTWLRKLAGTVWGPIPWMIEVAALLSAAVGDWTDCAIIVSMLLVNAAVEFWQEHKADDAIRLLKQRLAPSARVLRDRRWQTIPARQLVLGDIVLLRLGNVVPADGQLIAGDYLSTDEAALTGESLPVEKKIGEAVYSGSIVRLGEMTAVVTATGMNTFFGRTARLVEAANVVSHFQRAVLRIGNVLILGTLALVVLILGVALFRHTPLLKTLQFALILTVAAIPVALPMVLSVTMAVGAEKLARMRAIVSRLVAIEELAGADMLCADKTGTLTQNKLTVGDPLPAQGVDASDLLLAAVLASNAQDADAIDTAVLARAGQVADKGASKVVSFKPFDPVRKRTEAQVDVGGRRFTVSKGAPQVIIDLVAPDDEFRKTIDAAVERCAQQGQRTIAVARQQDGRWQYLGLLPVFDPPREDSAAVIERARQMGLQVKMITGDHEAIARQIGGALGIGRQIASASELFAAGGEREVAQRIEAVAGVARVFPEHKFRIVKALQDEGHIVAMTGDGVNDAPALKQADVGIAVSGATDAARAAADLVLTAPGLSVIAAAIEEARRIFERMTSYATFRIAETIRVLLFMTLSIVVFDFYPVTAVMIVLLAILNDFPIMMIAYDNAPVAPRPVRWDMTRVLTVAGTLGVTGVASTFLLFWYVDAVLHLPRETIQTVMFLKLLVAGHLTIYITRNQRFFWLPPWPSARLFLTCEATQIVGTLLAVYGVAVTPIGWRYALAIWAYALASMLVGGIAAAGVRRLLDLRAVHQRRYLARTGSPLSNPARP